MKIKKIKYKDNWYDIKLDDDQYELYKNTRLYISNARGNLFAYHLPITGAPDTHYLHKIITGTQNTTKKIEFKDGDRLNLQKTNMVVLTPDIINERRHTAYLRDRKKTREKQKRNWAELKTENPEEYQRRLSYIYDKTKEYREEKTRKRLEKCWKEQAIRKYEKILTRNDVLLLIRKFLYTRVRANERKMDFNLNFEYYVDLISKGCYYTGENLLIQDHSGCSLDRIDNNKGYEIGNVVACIGWVNKMRMDHMTVEETKIVVDALLNFRKTKKKL